VRLRRLVALFVALSFSVLASAQSSGSDPLQAIKDSLSSGQQGSVLQNILGKGDANAKKSDGSLNSPETAQPKNEEKNELLENAKKGKTLDGRTLRQAYEDPELRADDTVLIELTPLDEYNKNGLNNQGGANSNGPPGVTNGSQNGSGVGPGNLGNLGVLGNLSGLGASGGQSNGQRNTPGSAGNGRDFRTAKPKTDDERESAEKFRKRILSGNPYKLNRFGVLEIPGLPAIPLAGLTADEATQRIGADPDLSEYVVKLTLLRLEPLGEESLKPFGYDLFEGSPSTFAPVSNIQVPTDYVVGPGDTFNVQLYGNDQQNYQLTVQRDGTVSFPRLGPIPVNGLSFENARTSIEQRVTKQLLGTRASITMGDLRGIRIFVLGEAEKPGSYTVSGLSTMTNALFVSGGVKKVGSLRDIQLKRNGRLVTELDLYDLLLHGDTSGDRQLMPGDVIFIPPIGNTISISGSVRRPAVYELRQEKTVAEAIDIAGGLLPDADQKLGQLERILPSSLREMRNIDLTLADGRSLALANGDKIRIPEIRPTLENSVTLAGYVFRAGSFEYHAGLRLTNLLPSVSELRPNADPHYIMIRRVVPPDHRIEVVSADLLRAIASPGSEADPELRPRDEITVFDLSAGRERFIQPVIKELELQATPERPEQIVSIDGRVKAPGRYPLEPSMRVSDLIRAGGSLEDAAFRGDAELNRYEVVDGEARKTDLISVNLAAIRRGDAGVDIALRPYDVLIVKPVAQWKDPGTITLAGEVRFPGKYPIHQGETLSSVLHRAGGLTDIAFADGAVFVREELKQREKDQIEILTNRLQGDLAALSLQAVASSAVSANSGAGAGAAQGLTIGQQLLQQLRDTKPVGRLVIDINRVMNGRPGGEGDVLLKDGDKLIVPKRSQEVTILGEVQSPTSHIFEPGLTRDDYIAKSGGATQKADRKRTYVVRANGDVWSGNRSGWFRRTQTFEIRPGDTIVVPLDTERVPALPLWQAVTTIVYNLAIGFILVHQYL
jgi:protein involved in polysaccharide export with SLBB domain